MSHEVNHFTYPYKCNKVQVQNELADWVRRKCWEEGGGMNGSIRWIDGQIYNSYAAATEAIDKLDRGHYDQLAVPYRELPHDITSKKIESLKLKIKEAYKLYTALDREVVVKTFKAQYVACKGCGSKLNKDHLNSNFCPLCRTDMRSETTQNKIKMLYQKWQNLQVELRKEEEALASKKGVTKWLVKIEYHM